MDRRGKARLLRLFIAGGILLAATGMSALSNYIIKVHFPDRPLVNDLLLEFIPGVTAFQYISDVIATLLPISLLILLVVMKKWNSDRAVGDSVAMAGLMYALRAGTVILTPMLSPHGDKTGTFGLLPPQTGMYPSGHTALTFLSYLIVSRGGGRGFTAPATTQPWLRWVFASCVVVEMVGLLFGRGHYSIDLVGGLLLGYFIHAEWVNGAFFFPVKYLLDCRCFIKQTDKDDMTQAEADPEEQPIVEEP